jgi:putative membrane-bound dehydrogenase-like protein
LFKNALKLSLILLITVSSSLIAKDKKVLFLAGKRSHGAGQHEHRAGSLLLADALNKSKLGISAKVINVWPKDLKEFDDVDAVVVYADAGGRFSEDKVKVLDQRIKDGMGIMFIHYGVHPSKNVGQKYFLPWIGGYFENRWSVNPHWTAELVPKKGHPVSHGISKPITANDEFYYNMRFPKECKECYPLAGSILKPEKVTLYNNLWNEHGDGGFGKQQTLMWCRDPEQGGRGVGFSGGHFHHNWAIDDLRKMVLNSIVWIARGEVPKSGVASAPISDEQLNQNLDSRPRSPLKKPVTADILKMAPMIRPKDPANYNQKAHYAMIAKKKEKEKAKKAAQTGTVSKPELVDTSYLQVPDDLEVTVWSKSPHFRNPTNMDMDAHGRMWVTEGVNYRRNSKRQAGGDRVVVLQDTNKDGKVDKSHVFVQEPKLVAPLGIAVFGNRILVSQPPELIVYTDLDNNLKFDPKIDKREILLTGFNGLNHDHSLHAVTAGPAGKWYINQGNCGAQVTDKSGKTFRVGSSYKGGASRANPVDSPSISGKKSDDGYVWIGGFIGRMNPDGSNLEVVGHNMRNSYEHTVNSLGEIFQSDNDDPPACRNSYVLEYGSAGFFSADGKISWETARRPGQSIPVAHWRQEDPGFMPSGDVYGSGAPTGVAFYENGALPEKYNGMYLAAEAAQRVIFQYFPKANGAGYEMKRSNFVQTNNKGNAFNFRPSDVEVGADGAIYICDWYDSRVGGHATNDNSLSGAIYRIAPKGFKAPKLNVDLKSINGLIELLKSPSDNVRFLAVEQLKKQGSKAIPALKKLMTDKNKWIAARAIWILPYLGAEGQSLCEDLLKSQDENVRMVAFKALRRSGKDMLAYSKKLVTDSSALVRREIATALRAHSFADKKEILLKIYDLWDGEDKTYMEVLGLCVTYQESEFWNALNKQKSNQPWNNKFARMTWRLHPAAAVPELIVRANDFKLTEAERKLAIDTIAFVEGKTAPAAMLKVYLQNGPQKDYAHMWLNLNFDGNKWDGLIDRDLIAEKAGVIKPGKPIPYKHPEPPKKRNVPALADILKLKGDAERGKMAAARCVMCHKIGELGSMFGPSLNGWGKSRSSEQIVTAVLNPDQDIAHGYHSSRVYLKNGDVIDGLIKSGAERAWHFVNIKGGDSFLIIKTMGGQQQKISWRYIKSTKPLKTSMMLYPESLGLSEAQDFADIAEYLKTLK